MDKWIPYVAPAIFSFAVGYILSYWNHGLAIRRDTGARRRPRSLAWACAICVVLQLVTFFLMLALASLGSAGNTDALDFPAKVLLGGLLATAILTCAKALQLGRGPGLVDHTQAESAKRPLQ